MEIERLRQVYEQQNLKNLENNPTQTPSTARTMDANKLPTEKEQLLNVSS